MRYGIAIALSLLIAYLVFVIVWVVLHNREWKKISVRFNKALSEGRVLDADKALEKHFEMLEATPSWPNPVRLFRTFGRKWSEE